jgi:ankyrin repeat protein
VIISVVYSHHTNIPYRFLLLVLNFEYICKCHGRDDLQFSLGTIKRQDCDMDGHGSYKRVLDEAFTRNIHRALDDSNNGEDAKQILGFIRDVKRPLSAAELCELVRIRIPYDKPVHGSLPLWETLQPYCQGLVVANDKEVNFLHPSLRNFLEHNDGKILIPSQHEQLAKRCCAYLTLDCCSGGVRTTQESLNHRLEAWPFLDYAARYWPEHIRCLEELDKTQSRSMNPGSVYGLALQFLKQDAHVQASTQITLFPDLVLRKMQKEIARNSNLPRTLILVKGKEEAKPIDPFKNNEMTGLHLACLHNLRCLVPILLTEGRPSSQLGQLATAPISMAPIHLAAISGCKETMRMLLEANLDPGLQASNGTTPLMLATMSGHHDVVSTLLSADQTKATIDTQTVALISPIEMAVELNLRNGPNDAFALDLLNIYRPVTGRTALHCAAREGHLKILRLLLQAKANMTLQDSQGQTALHKAAKKGHLMVLQELISEGMDPHVKVAETPESLLAKLNPLRWFRTIDQTGEPSNDSYDGYHGWNILHLASSYSRSNAIVKHVLKSFPQLCEATNSRGETPLYLAIVNEAFQNVQTLLEYRPSLVHAVTHNGRTMLHAAARSSPVAILEMIFERCNVDINVEDDQGATPLHNAVEFMNVKNVEFLLSKDGINVNHRDKNGVSVTIKGVLSFNQLIMEMFHKHPQVKLDIQDGDIIFMSSTTIGRRIIRQTIDE